MPKTFLIIDACLSIQRILSTLNETYIEEKLVFKKSIKKLILEPLEFVTVNKSVLSSSSIRYLSRYFIVLFENFLLNAAFNQPQHSNNYLTITKSLLDQKYSEVFKASDWKIQELVETLATLNPKFLELIPIVDDLRNPIESKKVDDKKENEDNNCKKMYDQLKEMLPHIGYGYFSMRRFWEIKNVRLQQVRGCIRKFSLISAIFSKENFIKFRET